MILKLFHKDGSIVLLSVEKFGFDTDDNSFNYEDDVGVSNVLDNEAVTSLLVYTPGGVVIFTRDLETMKPIENFNV